MVMENGMSVKDYKEAMLGYSEWLKETEMTDNEVDEMFAYYEEERTDLHD